MAGKWQFSLKLAIALEGRRPPSPQLRILISCEQQKPP